MSRIFSRLLTVACLTVLGSGMVRADPAYVPKFKDQMKQDAAKAAAEKKKGKKKKPLKQGWIPKLKASFNFSMAQSQGVVGVPDGTTVALGLQLESSVLYRHGGHEWETSLDILQTQSKIPGLDPFIKSADRMDIESLYRYMFKRPAWLGVYAGIGLTTPLFSGNLIKDADQALDLDGDGTADATAQAQKPYRLTRPFSPLMFRQFAGLTAKPLTKPWLTLETRLGTGATEVWTRSGYVVADDDSTANLLELNPLENYVQGGVEVLVLAEGHLAGKLLTYGFKADVVFPYATSVETDLKGLELTTVDLSVKIAINLAKWAALTYSLSVVRYPLIVDKWQVANNLMLSLTASVGE